MIIADLTLDSGVVAQAHCVARVIYQVAEQIAVLHIDHLLDSDCAVPVGRSVLEVPFEMAQVMPTLAAANGDLAAVIDAAAAQALGVSQ